MNCERCGLPIAGERVISARRRGSKLARFCSLQCSQAVFAAQYRARKKNETATAQDTIAEIVGQM